MALLHFYTRLYSFLKVIAYSFKWRSQKKTPAEAGVSLILQGCMPSGIKPYEPRSYWISRSSSPSRKMCTTRPLVMVVPVAMFCST